MAYNNNDNAQKHTEKTANIKNDITGVKLQLHQKGRDPQTEKAATNLLESKKNSNKN